MWNKSCGDCRFLEGVKKFGICEKQEYPLCPSELPSCSKFEQKVITNGDRIHQLSNDDFAEFLTENKCGKCIYYDRKNYGACKAPKDKTCVDGIEDWLNAPAESQLNDAIQNVIKDGVEKAIDIHEAAYAPDMNDAIKESAGTDE